MSGIDTVTRLINRVYKITKLQRSQAFQGLGITGSQHSYVLQVCSKPGISQDKLAKALYVNKSNVARQAAQLCEAGFLTRRESASDKRVVLLYPTEKSLEIYPKILTILAGWDTYLSEALSEEERETLKSLLARVGDRAESYLSDKEGSL